MKQFLSLKIYPRIRGNQRELSQAPVPSWFRSSDFNMESLCTVVMVVDYFPNLAFGCRTNLLNEIKLGYFRD